MPLEPADSARWEDLDSLIQATVSVAECGSDSGECGATTAFTPLVNYLSEHCVDAQWCEEAIDHLIGITGTTCSGCETAFWVLLERACRFGLLYLAY